MKENLKFTYKNWKGVVADREVSDPEMVFTQSDWHGKEDQWFMKAIDLEKGDERMFAVKDIIKFL